MLILYYVLLAKIKSIKNSKGKSSLIRKTYKYKNKNLNSNLFKPK